MDITQQIFDTVPGWVGMFNVAGRNYGGHIDLCNDPRLQWHIETVGGLQDKRVLELGPMEGAHTKTICDGGAEVFAIEGDKNNFLKCLIVKELFELPARFIRANFCEWVNECKDSFDIVSAAGVLYHQQNPVELIFAMSKITDTVMVWSQVAGETHPNGEEQTVAGYNGKINHYGKHSDSYCGGLGDHAFWFYPDEMIRCFKDAGFKYIVEKSSGPTINGECLLFVASKNRL